MCGIAGYLGEFEPDLLRHFTDRLAPRGPNDLGSWFDKSAGVGLAHRRLSIIDPTDAAHQPMAAVHGRYLTVFNGEIYNFKQLQKGLSVSYSFNKNSDTAVLAPLYDAYGPKMLDRLEGMFAFGIFDQRTRTLWLARDHAGIKPLYYAEVESARGTGLVFASELKALVDIPGIDRTPDAAALGDYLTLLWSPGSRTPLRGIKKLLPGHWLRAQRVERKMGHGLEIEVVRWWRPPVARLQGGSPQYDSAIGPGDLLALLDDVVAEQCTSDVPVGAFLSGGVDSSALVASMVANHRRGRGPRPARTYCIGFGGKGMGAEGFSDDLIYARKVAKHLQVPLTEMIIEPADLLMRLPGLAKLLDEPTADPAPIFVQDICARARADGITVLLSGTGGDDIMTGYRRHKAARLREYLGPIRVPVGIGMSLAAQCITGPLKRRAVKLGSLLSCPEKDFLLAAFKTNSLPSSWQLLREDLRNELRNGWNNALTKAVDECTEQNVVDRLLYLEQFGFLPDHNLNYSDKASMASGVEVRVPLTDRRLMQFMTQVSPKDKLRGTRLKAFFKDALSSRLPSEIVDRSKAGFGAPIRLLLTGPGRELMEGGLFSTNAASWFDLKAVKRVWQQTCDGEVDGVYACLAVAMVAWWQEGLSSV